MMGLRQDADGDTGEEWTVGVDATVIRAHQHAAGARIAPPRDVPAHRLDPVVLEDVVAPSGHTGGGIE